MIFDSYLMLFETLLSCFTATVAAEHDIRFHRYKVSSNTRDGKDTATDACGGFSGKKVYIVADNGLFLARCYECQEGTQDTVTVHGRRGDGFAVWTLKEEGENCTLLSDVNKYAARCRDCWRNANHPDGVFNHVYYNQMIVSPWAQWKVDKHGDFFSFKTDTGKYMARCSGCVQNLVKENAAMVNYDTPTGAALWKIELA